MSSKGTALLGLRLLTTFFATFFKVPPCLPTPKLHHFTSVTPTPIKDIDKVGPGFFGNNLCCLFQDTSIVTPTPKLHRFPVPP